MLRFKCCIGIHHRKSVKRGYCKYVAVGCAYCKKEKYISIDHDYKVVGRVRGSYYRSSIHYKNDQCVYVLEKCSNCEKEQAYLENFNGERVKIGVNYYKEMRAKNIPVISNTGSIVQEDEENEENTIIVDGNDSYSSSS